ncbi:hypothetical protein [Thiohalomonas denitrificans]|uniref:Uncharacterized protein n=1 Tax=Thiohalomonas denitrificans TaxID=415747 RepID=A0A1G5QR93_9GAMM|nr:hypothetical protein [Thiohalomonas denitrificans]SCZ64108.1 hypothetical protein SAMN03097708_02565 [Thiohalomonas denitrificans]
MADEQGSGDNGRQTKPRKRKSLSMHEGIAYWCDCCPCEAEERWVEVGKELGIDMKSDYEDEEPEEDPSRNR